MLGVRTVAFLRRHSDHSCPRGRLTVKASNMLSIYQPSTRTGRNYSDSGVLRRTPCARKTDGTDSADAEALHVHQSSGFLNRVHWFDSGRGHAFESL